MESDKELSEAGRGFRARAHACSVYDTRYQATRVFPCFLVDPITITSTRFFSRINGWKSDAKELNPHTRLCIVSYYHSTMSTVSKLFDI